MVEAVGSQVALHPQLLTEADASKPRFTDVGMPVLVDPPAFSVSDRDERPALQRLVSRYDPAERDELNRSFGHAGEQMVIEFEQQRLWRAGRDDLGAKVRWISDLDGDHLGYDVRSFELRAHAVLAVRQSMRIRRVEPQHLSGAAGYHFRNGAQMFDIKSPLEVSTDEGRQICRRSTIDVLR